MIRIIAGGYPYTLAPGEEAKLDEHDNSGQLRNQWLEVLPEQDWLSPPLKGQRIQLAHVVSYVEIPDEPAAAPE